MATFNTTIGLDKDTLAIETLNNGSETVLARTAFGVFTQNYWLARITPPSATTRSSHYTNARREFDRRYLVVPEGCARVQFDIKDLVYGFAYEFGGDRVNGTIRFPARIYCVYTGTNGTGTEAIFRICNSARDAMEMEQRMRVEANEPPTVAKPVESTLMQLPDSLAERMSRLYTEMVQQLTVINILENKLKDAGYRTFVPEPTCARFQDARRNAADYAARAWESKFLPVVQAEALRLGEEAAARVASKPQDAPVAAAAPEPQPVVTSPAAPQASLLDAIAEEHEAVVPTPTPAPALRPAAATNARELKAMQQKAKPERTANHIKAAAKAITTKSVMHPSTPARKPAESPAGSFPRPAHIAAPTGDDLPF